MNEYDREILKVLLEAGSVGISVQKISRHVYNSCNSFFNPIVFQDVHDYVLQYLQRNSKSDASLIVRAAQRGIYKLNLDNQESRQLMLKFQEARAQAEQQPATIASDLSLSLFDED